MAGHKAAGGRLQAARRKDTVVQGAGRRAQVRKASDRDISAAREAKFLTVLAESCNMSFACREAKVSVSGIYRRRRKVAAFRAAWGEAIAVAYQRLEMELLRRAFDGTEKVTTRGNGSEERVKEVSNQLGLQLLKMHRETAIEADREYAPEEVAEIRARLIDKLERLRLRDHADDEVGEGQ